MAHFTFRRQSACQAEEKPNNTAVTTPDQWRHHRTFQTRPTTYGNSSCWPPPFSACENKLLLHGWKLVCQHSLSIRWWKQIFNPTTLKSELERVCLNWKCPITVSISPPPQFIREERRRHYALQWWVVVKRCTHINYGDSFTPPVLFQRRFVHSCPFCIFWEASSNFGCSNKHELPLHYNL